jgi:excisionase family DNA binding protein
MQSYATTQRLTLGGQLQSLRPVGAAPTPQAPAGTTPESALIDQLLRRLADLIVDRLTERTEAGSKQDADDWMDARAAAAYLGIHRDTLRKLAAERAVPVHQDGPGCKLYFRRDELDHWRRSGRVPRSQLKAVA